MINKLVSSLIILLISPPLVSLFALTCERTPKKAEDPKPNLDKYMIEVSGKPDNYSPEETYIITLKSNPLIYEKEKHVFTEFMILAEAVDPVGTIQSASVGVLGSVDSTVTTFTHDCPHAVIQTNNLPKERVQISWKAPATGNGCIAIKATVYESSDSWYAGDGNLTKVLCEEEENPDKQPQVLEECTVCDEAKYEIEFQGLWSRNTHPKDFPDNMWLTKLSDLIGASHKLEKSFWNYDEPASDGLKLLAEEGNTSLIENDLKEKVKNDDIRTIIKARELSYPNLTGKSYTVVRVDKDNHLISLVSKITPSPDWLVGVSNLELCTKSGNWISSITQNLYPYDAGTDDGTSYTIRSSSTTRQSVKQITLEDDSSFRRDDGEPIKPVARLRIVRQKLYEKNCDSEETTTEPEETSCNNATYSDWSECSVTCGKGVQTRTIIRTSGEEADEENKDTEGDDPCLTQECSVDCAEEETRSTLTPESQVLFTTHSTTLDCKLGKWSKWSNCSAVEPCRLGYQYQSRIIVRHPENGGKACGRLYRKRSCQVPCDNDRLPEWVKGSQDRNAVDCVMGPWSEWSPCSSSCGANSVRQRSRNIVVPPGKNGKPCGRRTEAKPCRLPFNCDDMAMSYL